MLYTDMTKRAMQIAYRAHEGQLDKTGVPYIFHPYHIAEQMEDEIAVCAALLHDVVEDTDMTFEALAALGISAEVIEVLALLTHDEDTPYMDYIHSIRDSGNACAKRVKLADLRHNSDLTRQDTVTARDLARTEKYRQAMAILEG